MKGAGIRFKINGALLEGTISAGADGTIRVSFLGPEGIAEMTLDVASARLIASLLLDAARDVSGESEVGP